MKKTRGADSSSPSVDASLMSGTAVAFERWRPGAGYRHILRRRDIEQFITLLPDWDEIALGLERVVLAEGKTESDGWHRRGAIAIRAWPRGMWITCHRDFVAEHREVLERLRVDARACDAGVELRFTEPTVRAYQLLHVFLHELGHHHDRMTTRSRETSARGETYAEGYAVRYAARIWDSYETEFGW